MAKKAQNFYDLLDIPRNADDDQIRKAYFKAARTWHPDKNPDNIEVATEKFKLIAEANEILRDPQQRAAYDDELNNVRRPHVEDYGRGGGGFGGWGGFGNFGWGAPQTRMKTEEEMEWERARQERANKAFERACKQEEIDAKKDAERAEKHRLLMEKKEANQRAYQLQKAVEEKEREAREREDAARKKAEEEEEARIALEEKKRQDEEKKVVKQARQRLRALLFSKKAKVNSDELTEFMIARDATQLDTICCQIEDSKTAHEAQSIIDSCVGDWKAALREEKDQAEQQRMAQKAQAAAKLAAEANKKTREWTTPELALFAQACLQFPGGYPNRWKAVSEFLDHGGFTRDEKECVAKAQDLKRNPIGKPNGIVQPENGVVGSSAQPAQPEVEEEAVNASWTAEQQSALEAALVKHPSTMPAKERWQNIGAEVPGRTKKECVERFKFLREKATRDREEMTKKKDAAGKATEQKAKDAEQKAREQKAKEAKDAKDAEDHERQRLERERRLLEKAQEAEERRERARKQDEEAQQARKQEEEAQQASRCEKEEREARNKEARRGADEDQRIAKMNTLEKQRASRSRQVQAEELADNAQKRQDEVVVFESVYSDVFSSDREDSFTLRLGCSVEGECTVSLELPPEYPSLYPPHAAFKNLPLGYDEGDLCEQLEIFFAERAGEVMLYDWFEDLKERFEADGSLE